MALQPASGLLATVLEVECGLGRDPSALLEAVASTLASGAALPAQDTARGQRALDALVAVLRCSGGSLATSSGSGGSGGGGGVRAAQGVLSSALAAVDGLVEGCDERRKGPEGAVVALGCAARAGRAWLVVRHAAVKTPALPTQLPNLLATVSDLRWHQCMWICGATVGGSSPSPSQLVLSPT